MWSTIVEYQRRAGVELVRNRLEMFSELGGTGVLMMHMPFLRAGQDEAERDLMRLRFDALRRSLDELLPEMERRNIPIAVENTWVDTWEMLNALLDAYPPEWVGITYDSGHGNSAPLKQLELLNARRDRLMALHLHQPPFYETVDREQPNMDCFSSR